MFPNNSSIDSTLKKLLAACHKETQTSNVSLKDSGTATDTHDKGSLKVLEFSELVQDPKRPREITIIKDVFAEEIHDHNNPGGSASDDAIANRYTYCREVIKPYLKDYPKDCPVSDDQLIRDALDAAHEDFPDYEPCFEGYDGQPKEPTDGGKKDTPDKGSPLNIPSIRDKKINLNKRKSLSDTCLKDKNSSSSSCVSTKDKGTSKSNICDFLSESLVLNMDPDKVCPPASPKIKDSRCPKSKCPPSLEPCFNPDDPPAGPPSVCENKFPGAPTCQNTSSAGSVRPCDDNPTPPKKEKSCDKRSDMKEASRRSVFERKSTVMAAEEENKKTMIEAHNEAIGTIKSAVEDFFGKVYQSTKEAVTVIKTESARHLGRMTAKKSSASSTDLIPQKVHENKSSETITSFNYFRSTDNPDHKNQGTDNDEPDNSNFKKAGQAIGKIFATVDSTISMLSDQIDLKKVSSLLQFDNKNKSSSYDKVESRDTDETVSTSTSLPGSVFTAIKSKIVSMFSEGETETKGTKKSNASDTSLSDNNSGKILNLRPSKRRF